MEVVHRKVEELKPHPKNPRNHPNVAIEKIAKSIQKFGWTNPILVSEDGYILAGHARIKAAKKAGITEVPVIELPLREDQADAYLIADNRLQDETGWDAVLLKELVEQLMESDVDLFLTGLDEQEINELLHPTDQQIQEDDFNPEEEVAKIEEPISQYGTIWQLGRHRLMCGDTTKPADVDRLMNEELADMVFTDPPYNVDYQSESGMTILNDKMKTEAFYTFLYDAFTQMCRVTKKGGGIYICHSEVKGISFARQWWKLAGY